MDIITATYESPCGRLTLGSYGDRLCLCEWHSSKSHEAIHNRLSRYLTTNFSTGDSDIIIHATHLLDRYFSGEQMDFDMPLLHVGTDFQMRVWRELMNIPYGTTLSYAQLSHRLGQTTAMRAVANANGANAISIFTPCHRVIGSDGTLTGYTGGLDIKRYLLDLEK